VNVLRFFLCATCGGTFWAYRIFSLIFPIFRKRKPIQNSVFSSWHFHRNQFLSISCFSDTVFQRMRQTSRSCIVYPNQLFIISRIAFNMHNNEHPLSTTPKVLTAKLSILTQEIAILWRLESETPLCLFSFTGKCGEFKYAFVYRASANLFSESSAIRAFLSNGSLPTVTSTFQRWTVRLPSIEVLCLVHCGLSVCVISVSVVQWVRVYICVGQKYRRNCCKNIPRQ